MMRLFTLFGNPVKHSISPRMHNLAFKKFNINASYIRYLLEDGKKLKEIFQRLKFDGANITVPFKQDAFMQCDEVLGIAKDIKAVNTIVKRKNKIYGYNTDAPGFMMSIKEFLPLKTALIIGAGGTAKAIAFGLRDDGVKIDIVNRSEGRLKEFKENNFNTFTSDSFNPKQYDIIINTTSAGLHDDNLPLKEEKLLELLDQTTYAFDVIYHKITPFISLCMEKNVKFKDGKDMLLYQGVLAFNIFCDNEFEEKDITDIMREAFKL